LHRLNVDENREQTRASIGPTNAEKRNTDGLLTGKRGANVRQAAFKTRNACFVSLAVVKSVAKELRFIDDRPAASRHMKYLSLIRSIALLHQHKRKSKPLAPTTVKPSITSKHARGYSR